MALAIAILQCKRTCDMLTHTLSSCLCQHNASVDMPGSVAGCLWWLYSHHWTDTWTLLSASCSSWGEKKKPKRGTFWIVCYEEDIYIPWSYPWTSFWRLTVLYICIQNSEKNIQMFTRHRANMAKQLVSLLRNLFILKFCLLLHFKETSNLHIFMVFFLKMFNTLSTAYRKKVLVKQIQFVP